MTALSRARRGAASIGVALALLASARPARAELTVDQAVGVAVQRNRDLIAAKLEIEITQVERIAAGIYPNPVLQYTVGNLVLGAGNPQSQGLSPSPFSQTVHQIGVTQVVDVWAKRNLRVKTAELSVETRRLLVEDVLREIAFTVRNAFAEVVREQFELDLNRTTKARYDDVVRISKARATAGEISDFEFRKIELEGLKYQNALIDATAELDLARQGLAQVMGLPRVDDLPGPAAPTPIVRGPTAIGPLLERAVESRPDVRAAKKSKALAESMIASARREAYPDIFFGVAYTHSEFVVSGDNGNTLALTIGAPIPLFDRNQAGIARARIESRRAQNEIDRLALRVEYEVREAIRHLERAAATLDVYEGGGMLDRADGQLRVAENTYRLGQITLLELLEAQRTYLETRGQFLKVQDDYRRARFAVAHAVGEKNP